MTAAFAGAAAVNTPMTSARELIPEIIFLFTFPPYRYVAAKGLATICLTADSGGIYAPEVKLSKLGDIPIPLP
jgi:hypothetical protein